MRFVFCLVLALWFSTLLIAQDSAGFFVPKAEFDRTRCLGVGAVQVAGYGGSLALVGAAWYRNYDQSAFHSFDDRREWLQVDKAGHVMTSWYLGRMNISMLEWSGVSKRRSVLYGCAGSFLYMTGIEFLDGFSDGWGFSLSDMAANIIGTGSVIGQKVLNGSGDPSRLKRGLGGMSLRFSFHQTEYASLRPKLLGKNLSEQVLKDYNGQSYWLSVNLSSFLKEGSKFPRWLNVAAGYGAEGMISGYDEFVTLENGTVMRSERYRQYYLSLDIDLSRIRTRSHFIKTLAETFCFIKIPAPALEMNKKGLAFHPLYY